MTDREEFKQKFANNKFDEVALCSKDGTCITYWTVDEIYSYFQSKQQEKIEEIKKLTKGKGGTKYGIWADGYLDAIKKVLEILEK